VESYRLEVVKGSVMQAFVEPVFQAFVTHLSKVPTPRWCWFYVTLDNPTTTGPCTLVSRRDSGQLHEIHPYPVSPYRHPAKVRLGKIADNVHGRRASRYLSSRILRLILLLSPPSRRPIVVDLSPQPQIISLIVARVTGFKTGCITRLRHHIDRGPTKTWQNCLSRVHANSASWPPTNAGCAVHAPRNLEANWRPVLCIAPCCGGFSLVFRLVGKSELHSIALLSSFQYRNQVSLLSLLGSVYSPFVSLFIAMAQQTRASSYAPDESSNTSLFELFSPTYSFLVNYPILRRCITFLYAWILAESWVEGAKVHIRIRQARN